MAAIVLLPGMDGSGSLFADFVTALSARSLVVSYPPDQPLGYAELTQFVRDRLPTDEPFILVGESFSGPIAISLAASAPPTLRALVLVCTFAKTPGPPLPPLFQRLVSYIPVWLAPPASLASLLFGRYGSRQSLDQLSRAVKTVAPLVWRARLRAVLAVDATKDMSRISVPILYLRASEDAVVFRSASELICRHNPRAKVVDITAPHFLLQAKPQEAATALREFTHALGIPI